MNFFAVILPDGRTPPTASTLDRLKDIPPEFWMRLGVAIIALVLFVVFLRKVAKMNKVVLAAVTFIVVTVVGFNWIYERSEPAWATPVVNFLAGWFPTKGPPAKKPSSTVARQHP